MTRLVHFAKPTMAIATLAILALPADALATAVTLGRTEAATDYVSAGIGGIGSGPGTIVVTGVAGPVRKAFLYWHGIDNGAAGAVYDNQTIAFAGESVTGVSLGDAETNCWGAGGSRAFFADVTGLVDGNGSYAISGLNAFAGHNGNGASLIVLFNDGNDNNNRDLVFFEGNDSDFIQFGSVGDPAGWAAQLDNINYAGGSVFAQLHVGDGQSFADGTITFTGQTSVSIFDTTSLYDGNSVPNAGFSRAGTDGLWDIHKFDITAVFGPAGVQDVAFSGMIPTGDCHSLVVMMLDLVGGSAPCGNGIDDDGEECDPGSAATDDCEANESCLNDCTCGCASDFQCNDGNPCTTDSCNEGNGRCSNQPVEDGTDCGASSGCSASECIDGQCVIDDPCPPVEGCTDRCDEETGTCRTCGRPFDPERCIVNAVYVLQASLELRGCELCTCDVNDSGTVTASDALTILRGCAGIDVTLDCPVPEAAVSPLP